MNEDNNTNINYSYLQCLKTRKFIKLFNMSNVIYILNNILYPICLIIIIQKFVITDNDKDNKFIDLVFSYKKIKKTLKNTLDTSIKCSNYINYIYIIAIQYSIIRASCSLILSLLYIVNIKKSKLEGIYLFTNTFMKM